MNAAKNVLLGTVVTAVMALGMPMTAANADPGDRVHGSCYFDTNANQTVTQGQNIGVISAVAFMQRSNSISDSGASVECEVGVNGVAAPGTYINYPANQAGVVACQKQISFDDKGGTLPTVLCEKTESLLT